MTKQVILGAHFPGVNNHTVWSDPAAGSQIAALSGNIYAGLFASAIIFGAAHGYEGGRRMMLIVVLGLMFGVLALLRKGLRPGMIGHAIFDSVQGVILFVAARTGILSQ